MKKTLLAISILFCFVFNNVFAQASVKPGAHYREIAATYNKTVNHHLKTNNSELPLNPTVLTAGDIAVIGFNISNLKFSFVTMVTLNAGTVINFTDKGWTGTAFNTLTSEGTLTWTVGANVNAGIIVTATLSGASPDVSGFPNGTATYTGWSASVFSNNGDQMIVFQGTEASPTFIYGFNSSSANGSPNTTTDWQTITISSNRDSQLPTGLTNSTNLNAASAIAFTGQSTNHNWAYNGKAYGYSGTKSQLLTLIGNRANWAQSATALDVATNGTYFPTAFVVNAAGPTITTTGTLTAVNTTYGTATATPTSFTVTGTSLTSDITVTPPTGFELSTTAGGTYSTSLTLTQSGGAYSGTVYVRLAANATAGTHSGNITLSSTGATDKTVATASSIVTQAVLTYTANAASRLAGAADPTFSGTVTGFVNGETIAVTTGTAAWTTTATVASPSGSYPINGSGLSATNYTFTQAVSNATALTILPGYVVINTNDSGSGSLRDAITQANLSAGTGYNITFNIPGTAPFVISPVTVLPSLSKKVTIDGTSQPGYTSAPLVQVDGGVTLATGLNLSSGSAGSVIKGLSITRFTTSGISMTTGTNTISGCYIGVKPDGITSAANAKGIIISASANNIIGGSSAAALNVISGNTGNGLEITGAAATGNKIQHNYIGTDNTGAAILANGGEGVSILSSSNTNIIGTDSDGSNDALEGNVISGNTLNGINLGASSTGNKIAGNYIGTNAAGTAALKNTVTGIIISSSGATGNTIGGPLTASRNIISGNGSAGINVTSTGNNIYNNYIGTNAAGTAAIANNSTTTSIGAVTINASNNTVGSTTAGLGNVVSGNASIGIYMQGSNTGSTVIGNYVGTNAAGTAALGNATGISLQSNGITIGGNTTGAGNLISGNTSAGIAVIGSSNHKVQGNIIGLNAAGTTSLGGQNYGLIFTFTGATNLIGTDADGTNDTNERNIIAGNTIGGVSIGSGGAGNIIAGNYIGTDITGTLSRSNGSYGVFIGSTVGATTIGGNSAVAGNLIAGNTAGQGINLDASNSTVKYNLIGKSGLPNTNGIVVRNNAGTPAGNSITLNDIGYNTGKGITMKSAASTGNKISQNSIHDNGTIGIDLSDNGVTANDAGDTDTGPNGLLNFPVITTVTYAGGNTTIAGTIDMTAAVATYTVELFHNSVNSASKNGEGETYLGNATVTTDAAGHGTFSQTYPGTLVYISATATDASNNTSEFGLTRKVASTVSTTAASAIASTTAMLAGNVTDDGLIDVTDRGIVYSTTANPTTADTKVAIGTGTGIFSQQVTGFTANTLYHFRAYSVNTAGTSYGSDLTFTTAPAAPTLNTPTTVTTTGFSVSWNAPAGATSYRLDVSTTNDFSSLVTGYSNLTVGTTTKAVTGLTAGTTYYFRVRAVNSGGSISDNSTAGSQATVSNTPTIIPAGTLTAVNTTYGTATATPTSFTVTGSNLTANISVTVPIGFEVSTTSGGTYASTITLTQTAGAYSGTVYVRLAANAPVTTYTGNIALSSTGATDKTIATATSTVTAAVLTYTANTALRAVGAAEPTFSGTVTGFVNSETLVTATTGTVTWATTATVVSPAGSYPINGSGLSATNYTFAQAAGNATALTINAGPTPTIGTTGTLAAVNTTYGTASATPTSFAVTGSNLTADISVTAPTGFEVSTTSGGTYSSTLTLTQTGGAFSGNVYVRLAANTAAGTYSGNFILSSTGATDATIATASSDVAKAALTYTATVANRSYGSANPTFAGTVTGFVNSETQATATTGTLAFTSTATITSAASSYAINGSGLAAANYTFTQAAGNATALTIDKAPLTVTATGPAKTYGTALAAGTSTTNFTVTGTVAPGEALTGVTLTPDAAGLSATTAAAVAYSVLPSLATGTGGFLTSNYNITYTPFNGTVTKAALTITASTANKTYGQALSTATGSTAFTSSGLQNSETIGSVTRTFGTGSAANANVGTYTLQVTPSAATGGTFNASNYNITYNSGSISVGKAALTIEANGVTKVPGTTLTGGAGSSAFVATGLQNGETAGTITIAYGTGSLAADAPGTYTNSVVPSALTGGTINAGNYTITYLSADIIVGTSTITVNVAGGALQPRTTSFGTASATTTFTISGSNLSNDILVTPPSGFEIASSSGGPFGNTVTLTANSGGVGTTNVYVRLAATTPVGNSYNGNVVVTSTGAITQNVATQTSTVNAAPITITATNVTKTYGTALTGGAGSTAYTLTSGTLKNGNTLNSVTVAYSTGAAAGATVATYTGAVTPSAAVGANGFLASNYNITYVSGDVIVNAKTLTVTAVASSKAYDKTTTSAATPTVSGLMAGDVVTAGPFETYDSPNVGTARILTPSGIEINGSTTITNYTVNYVGINTGIITPETLTYAATTASKVYGDANPTFTGTVTGFVTGDTEANATTGTLAFTSAATISSVPGTYAINGSGLTATNYTFAQAAGNTTALTVNKATLTYVATQASKTYGDANPTFTGTVTGLVNSENLAAATTGTVAWASPATASSIPGTYAINGSGLSAANYNFVQDAGNSTKFLINDFTTPTNPATNILFSNVGTGGFTASWTNGSGTSRAVFIAAVTNGSPSPANNTTYTANTVFGSGTQIGASGWYCVYNGTGSTVNISGLSASTDYTLKVVEYNGIAGYEKYSPPAGANNPKTQATNSLNTTVSSIARNSATLTKNTTEQYTVTFGAAISGLSASNFSITTTGTLSGTSVGTITGSGTTYTVTVNTGTGSGDLTLNLANATGLTPGISTSLPFTGQTYNVDKTAPDVSSGTFVSNNTVNTWAKTGDLITLNFKANEKLQTPTVSIAGHTVTATNPSTDQINWTASYTMAAGDTEGLVDFNATITDLAGNASTETFTAAGTHQTLAFDKTAPTISIGSPSVNATNTGPVTYTVTYADAHFDASTLSAGNISLNKTGTADAAGISVSGTGNTRTITLTGISGAGTLGINIAAGTAKDAAGNLAPGSSASGTFAVSTAQTITFASTATKTYGDADFNPGATSTNNGTAITYASDNSAVATIVSGKVHIVGVGTANITASQAADATHSAATDVVQQLTVSKKDLIITANNKTKNYGDELFNEVGSQAFTTSGLINGESIGQINVEYSNGKAANAAVGTYPAQVRPFQALGGTFNSANYTITYVKGDIIVNTAVLNIAATGPTKEYGTALTTITNSTTNFSANGLQNGETITSVTLTPNPSAASATTSVGTPFGMAPSNAAGANGFVASNYHINYIAVVDFVKAKALTVTAKNANKTYGQQLTGGAGSVEFTSTGLANSETIGSVTIAYGTGASAAAAVGTYTGSATATGATGGTFDPANYTISYTAGDIIIGAKAITVAAAAKNKTYGDVDPTLTYTNNPLVGTDTFTGSLTRDVGENKGTYSIKQGTLALSSNYTLSYIGADLTIGAKAITVTAAARNKTYGDVDPALTYTNTALVGTDAFTGSLTRDVGENVGIYAIKQGTLALSSNYTLAYAGANLSIGAKTLTIASDNKTKVYGSTNPTLSVIYTGFTNGDDASKLTSQATATTTATAASAVGTYPITASGAASPNYNISYTGGTLTVSPAALTIAADSKTKVYGSANPALTATYTGFVNGDTNASLTTQPSLTTTATVASAAGTYAINVAGAASANYNIGYTAGTLTVNNTTLTITATNASKTYGAANPTLAFTYSGFVNGDTQASLSTLPSISTTATAASGAGTYPITVSGALSANYTLVYVPATLTVNKAILNISADNKSRNYGVANPSFTVSYSGFVNGDTQASLSTQATALTNATSTSLPGTYPIVASGAISPNYSFTYSSGIFTVLPLTNATLANLTISSGNLSPVFGGGTFNYTTSVIFAVNQVTLTPTFDPTATITINGATSGNGTPSAPIALASGDNIITIVVTAQDGVTKLTYTVKVHRPLPPAGIIPTNVLSPNGDGKNDAWTIKDIELYPNNKVTIYDRAGREVYSKKGYNNDWDGTLKGAPLAQGTYYYLVDLGPGYETLKGFITILKTQ